MGARLFLSQDVVERAAAAGAELSADALVARGGALDGARFALIPAARVLGLASGDDARALTGKVRSMADLVAIGGELLGTSMLLGDVAYDLEPGFLATPDPSAAAALFPASSAGQEATEESPPQGQSDAESLARFLLNTLP